MNNLQQLNDFSAGTIEFEDNRPPGFIYAFDQVRTQYVVINEGIEHLVPPGIEIEEVINYDLMTSYYEIDVSSQAYFTVTWPTIPSHMTVTIPSTGVYRITGFRSAADWAIVRRPIIATRPGFTGEMTYTATLGYLYEGIYTDKTWDVELTVIDISLMDNASDFFFDISNTHTAVTGFPLIQEGDYGYTYTLRITPSSLNTVVSLASGGTGGTSSYNAVTKVLTITGTKTEVNSHLETITYVSNGVSENYSWTYYLINNSTSEADTKIQQMKCNNIRYFALPTTNSINYNEDTYTNISGGPLVTDLDADGSGTYVIRITGPGVRTLSATGTGGSVTFNNSNKTLSIVGSRTQVNSYIANIVLLPTADLNANFSLTYTVTTPTGAVQAKAQSLEFGSSDVEATGLGVTRYYVKNTGTYLFGTTAYTNTSMAAASLGQSAVTITDADPIAATYSLTITTNTGVLSADNLNVGVNYLFTGTRAECNAAIAGLRLYAPKDVTGNITITYVQKKNNVTQVNTSFVVSSVNSGAAKFENLFVLLSTQTWQVPYDTKTYSTKRANIMVMGGGGAGGFLCGGGGGGYVKTTNYNLSASSYAITIGFGGTPRVVSGAYGEPLDLEQPRGKSTTAFGLTATGGEGGNPLASEGVYSGKGGSSGLIRVTPGDAGFTYAGGNANYSSGMSSAQWAGGGGGGAGGVGYNSRLDTLTGREGGSGSLYIEFPVGSGKCFGGGGGGAGAQPIYAVNPPNQYDINAGYPTIKYPVEQGPENPASYPTVDNWGGGGTGYPFSIENPGYPFIAGQTKRDGSKGGGGGGNRSANSTSNRGAGGNGVVVIEVL